MDFVNFADPSTPSLNALATQINAEAQIAKIPPCLLAAIVMRETGGQNVFQEGMPHAPGCGVGLCQITSGVNWTDPANPTFAGYDLMNESNNLYVAAAYFLAPLMADAVKLAANNPAGFAASCRGQDIFAIACGYNAGWGSVQAAVAQGVDADGGTTNGYGAAVLGFYEQFVAASRQANS